MHSARVIQVIETTECAGKGIDTDPVRTVVNYWTLEGVHLASVDPMAESVTPAMIAEFDERIRKHRDMGQELDTPFKTLISIR